MFYEDAAKSWLRNNIRAYVPSTSRSYKPTVITNRLDTSSLGCRIDHAPFTGIVIEANPDFSVVKTGRTEFMIIDPAILHEQLHVGSTVSVTPYARRRFDGSLLRNPLELKTESGVLLMVNLFGNSVSQIPVDPPKSELGKHFLDHLQRSRCPDGIRVLSNLLVDIGATNFVFVDPVDDGPGMLDDMQLIFDCTNRLFSGRVTVGVDRSLDLFYLEMHKVSPDEPEVLQHRCENIDVDSLPEVMSTLLCDGEWKFAQVEILKRAKATLKQPATTS